MQTIIHFDEYLMRELIERARDVGTSTNELAAAFVREGLGKPSAASSAHSNDSHRNHGDLGPARLPSGLPQVYLESGTEVTLETLTGLLNAVEADDNLGSPLAIDEPTRAEIIAYAREHDIPIGLLTARLLQQSLLYRKEWPSWHGIPQIPPTHSEPVTFEFVKQLQEELDLEDFLD